MTAELVEVRTFADQDLGRIAVQEITARAVQDVLYLLDSATGPDGADAIDSPPDPETSRLYAEFRDWFGPQVGAAIQGLVVGPLLSRLSVDNDGRAYIRDEPYRAYLSGDDRLSARIKWLTEEIPSLIDTYRQLRPEEEVEAAKCVKAVLDLDLSDRDMRRIASEMLPTLEQWFMFANPGAKIMRGDAEALKALADSLDGVRARIRELEAEREQARENIEGGQVTEADRDAIEFELSRVEQQIVRFEKKLETLDERREVLVSALPNAMS